MRHISNDKYTFCMMNHRLISIVGDHYLRKVQLVLGGINGRIISAVFYRHPKA